MVKTEELECRETAHCIMLDLEGYFGKRDHSRSSFTDKLTVACT